MGGAEFEQVSAGRAEYGQTCVGGAECVQVRVGAGLRAEEKRALRELGLVFLYKQEEVSYTEFFLC